MGRMFFSAAVLAWGSLFAIQAHASLIGDQVTVALTGSGNGLDNTDTVFVTAGVEFQPGNGTNIGNSVLLTGGVEQERIDIGSTTIFLRVLGYEYSPGVYSAGFNAAAKYVFSGLDITDETIIGITGTATGVSNFNSNWFTLDNSNQVSFAIGRVEFIPVASGDTFGDFTITLSTRSNVPPPGSAPEPGSLALAGLALAALGWSRRRRTSPVR